MRRFASLVALSLTLWSPPSLLAADRGGRLVYSERQPLLGFEPVIRTNVSTTRFTSMLFEHLLQRKRIGIGVECRLCESYSATEKIVTFNLKKNVKWHNGIPMDAQDVAFSYRAVLHPETGSALARELDNVEDVTLLDDYTVSFTLRQPVAVPEVYFLALPILPAHQFTSFAPSIDEAPDPGKVREMRVHNLPLYAEPKRDSRLILQVPIGAQISIVEARRGWAHVKIIGKGPTGKDGWIERYVPIIGAKTSADFLTRPVGTGPYKFLAASLNGDANLKSFAEYHDDLAYIDQIRRARSTDPQTMVTRLTSEVIDLIPDTPIESISRITASGVAKTIAYPSLKFVGLLYNTRNPVLAQKSFRQALTYGTNRKQWLQTFYQDQGSLIAGPAGPDSWLYDSRIQPLAYEQKKALSMLAAAEKRPTAPLELIVANSQPPQDLDMLQAYINALADLGVPVKQTVMESGVYQETLKAGKFDIALVEWTLSYGYNFRPLFEGDGVQNYGAYRNEELDKIFEQWRVETDFEKTRELAYRAQAILADEVPYTFLWSLKNICAVNNKVRKIGPDTIDPYAFFAWVHVWWIPSISQ